MDFNKKYLGIPLGIILLLAMIATVAAASLVVVYETTLTGQVTVEETTSDNSYEITIYETSSCEHELTSVDFGSGKPGDRLYSSSVYVKNTSDSYIPYVGICLPDITAEGWTMGSAYQGCPLEVGEVTDFAIHLGIRPDAQPGDYSGEIKIVAKASETSS